MSENECSICNDNDLSKNLNCYTCNKSICIKCCNNLQNKSFINYKIKNELFIKYQCPYCRDFNNRNLKLFNKDELINIFANLLSEYAILQNNNEYFINYNEFEKVDIRIGTIIEAYEYNELKKPSIILKIDFGEKIGIKKTSAQLQKYYKSDELINKQVIAVINFEPKQIGKIISEVLVLGMPDLENEPVLLTPDKPVNNGGKLF